MHRVSLRHEGDGDSSTGASMEAGLSLLEKGELSAIVLPRRRASSPSADLCDGLQGPCRLLRLCILGIVVPACLIAIPVYIRYHVLHEQQYPVAYSDVRLIDGRVSTTWCQRQMVKGNASFNAYLVPETPKYNEDPSRVSMTRHMILEDDMKEYWGFYLLPGSQVHVKACSRWPGASLIVIKGHKHLRDCAYIGDNSSEEEDEAILEESDKNEKNGNPKERLPKHVHRKLSNSTSSADASTASPRRQGTVSTEKPQQRSGPDPVVNEGTITIKDGSDLTSGEALDELLAKVSALGPGGERALRKLAEKLHPREEMDKEEPPVDKDQLMVQLLQDLLRATGSKLTLQPVNANASSDGAEQRSKRAEPQTEVDHELELRRLLESVQQSRVLRRRKRIAALAQELHGKIEEFDDAAFEEDLAPDGIADTRGHISENTTGDGSNEEEWSSFSSSEETLMQCEGLLLYLPLTPRNGCSKPNSAATLGVTDTYSYTATTSGYYFFVFNSENEIKENLISAEFSLVRTTYDTSRRVAQCDNTTDCAFPLDFFSSEKVVLEVPVAFGREGPNDSNDTSDSLAKHWNEEYLIVSTCEPRTSIYLFCMMLVPVLVLTFAFQ